MVAFQVQLRSSLLVCISKIMVENPSNVMNAQVLPQHILIEEQGTANIAPHAIVLDPLSEVLQFLRPLFSNKKIFNKILRWAPRIRSRGKLKTWLNDLKPKDPFIDRLDVLVDQAELVGTNRTN